MPSTDLAENVAYADTTHPTQIANADLVDELGSLNDLKKAIEEREKALKDEIKRRGGHYYEGFNFVVNVNEQVRTTLNKNAVIDRLGEDWVNAHSRITPYRAVTVEQRRD